MIDIRPEDFRHQVTLPSDIASIARATSFVAGILAEAGAPPAFIGTMRLVVDEAVANAISHGGGGGEEEVIVLSAQVIDGVLQILVEDFHGRMFDPEYFRRIARVKERGKGGLGILIMESLMDHMAYLIEEGSHTMLFLQKTLPPPTPRTPASENVPGHPQPSGGTRP